VVNNLRVHILGDLVREAGRYTDDFTSIQPRQIAKYSVRTVCVSALGRQIGRNVDLPRAIQDI
jgi:hypothetical protein